MMNVPENELFSAYLDGELTAAEQAKVERLLATSPAARQLVDELRALSASLQSLPVERLEGDLSGWVLRQAERRILGDHPDSRPRPSGSSKDPGDTGEGSFWRRFLRPRTFLWSALAVAFAVALTLQERGGRAPEEIALAPPAAPRTPSSVQAWDGPVLPAEGIDAELPVAEDAAAEPVVSPATSALADKPPAAQPTAMAAEGLPPAEAAFAAEKPTAAVAAEEPLRDAVKSAGESEQPGPPAMHALEEPAPEQPGPEKQPAAGPAALAESAPPPASAQPAGDAAEAVEEMPAAEAPEAPDVLVVYCDVSAEVLGQELFDQVLAKRKVSVVEAWQSGGGAEAADRRDAPAETKVFRVDVTAQQLAKVLGDLRSRPEAYLAVKTEANRPVGGTAIQGIRIGGSALGGRATIRLGPAASAGGNLGADATTGAVSASPSAAVEPGVTAPKSRGGITFRGNIGVRTVPAKPGEAAEPRAEKAAEPAATPAAPKPLRVRFVLRAVEPEAPAAAEPDEAPAETPAADQP